MSLHAVIMHCSVVLYINLQKPSHQISNHSYVVPWWRRRCTTCVTEFLALFYPLFKLYIGTITDDDRFYLGQTE